jgi:Trk K+ transport system NAD-binding subunit
LPLKRLDLPKECLIALVKRGSEVRVPDGDSELRLGDIVTLIGQRDAVEQLETTLETDI